MKYSDTNRNIPGTPRSERAFVPSRRDARPVRRAVPPPAPGCSQCDTLFAAILADDDVDPVLGALGPIELDFSADELGRGLTLCRRLWSERYDRAALLALLGRLAQGGALDEAGRREFKHIRARLKHLRYAYRLYGAGGDHPRSLNLLTAAMGHVQDAYRNDRRRATIGWTLWLRALLAARIDARVARDAAWIVPATPVQVRAMLLDGYAGLARLAERPTVDGPDFHAARKIVGRLVSFVDTLRTIAPSDDRYRLSRWLSAINGLMGARHDELVAAAAADPAAYGRPFALSDDVRTLIEQLCRAVAER